MSKFRRRVSRSSHNVPPPIYTPLVAPSSPPLPNMTVDEGRAWIEDMRKRLIAKQQRERAYLDRRAARGTHTPTDDAYEADQHLETEILALFDDLLAGLAAQEG